MEAAGIFIGVLTDHHPFRQLAPLVDHYPTQSATRADLHTREDNGLIQSAEGVDPHIGKEHRTQDERATDDGAPGKHGVDGHAVLAVSVLHELGGRSHVLTGPDGPVLIVDIQLRRDGSEIHIGLPEGVHGAHISPVGAAIRTAADTGHAKRVSECGALFHHAGDHVHAEIVMGLRVGDIFIQQLIEILGIEDIDPHGGQGVLWFARHGGRVGRFFDKRIDLAIIIHRHHPEGACFAARYFDTGHGDLGAHIDVIQQHGGVIHLVDVIARQHHHIFGGVIADDVQVLIDRIGGATIPVHLVHSLLGREQIDKLVHLIAQEGPAGLQVAQQAVGFVLGDDTDPADAGVDAVGEHEIDDAEFAAKMHRRLGPVVG